MSEGTINTVTLTAIFFAQLFASWQAARAATKAALVKATLAETTAKVEQRTEKMEAKVDAVHGLVNSATLALLRENAEQARAIAQLTGTPEDIARAERKEQDVRNAVFRTDSIPPEVLAKADFPNPV